MPQIEQLQLVHWGSLRPDPIELDPGGINVATGGNGSGKTCLLDAAKSARHRSRLLRHSGRLT
jgi:recombinational DNA repair ATPase RecF